MMVEMLKQIQKREGLSNSQFATSLGIHRGSWTRNKRTGTIGADVLLKAFEVYPELRDQFLSSFATTTITPNTPESHCVPKWAIFLSWVGAFIVWIRQLRFFKAKQLDKNN